MFTVTTSFVRRSIAALATMALVASPFTTLTVPTNAADDPIVQPAALMYTLQPLAEVDRVSLLPLDMEKVNAEDLADEAAGLAPRYAVPHPVHITPETHGTWEAIDRQTSVWRLVVAAGFAWHINLGFTRYLMPEGAQLLLYTPDTQHMLRPFTSADNVPQEFLAEGATPELWTPPLPGDMIVIEVTIPNSLRKNLDLTLGSINVGYRKFGPYDGSGTDSGSCNIDVVCGAANSYPEIDQWRLQIPAIGVISTGGSRICSGYMVNNTANDRAPYFMTANHCGLGSGNAGSLVVYWNYQNSFCRTPGSAQSGQAGNGSLAQFSTGSQFRSASSTSDFTLVLLNTAPNPAWGVTYAGWNAAGGNSPSGTIIHHPNTEEKRITFYSTLTNNSAWSACGTTGTTHVRAFYSWPAGDPRHAGTTEPGSSGSPIFDSNKRIIGQLHGGPASCSTSPSNSYDCYGRFSVSWTGGGTNTTRLSNWLDATNTGLLQVDTLGPGLTISGGNVTHQGPTGGPFSSNPTAYNISNTSGNSASYSVSILGGGSAPLLLNGGAGPVSGSLANGSNVNVSVSLGASANSLSPGIYASTVRFQDTTNNLTTDRVHTLQVGQVTFSVTPAGGLSSSGPQGGPFSGSQVYTVTNTNVNSATVRVARSVPWVTLNGGTGPVDLVLPNNGSSASVTVAFGGTANSLPSGLHSGNVSFTNITGGGSGTSSDTTRAVSLEVGSYNFNVSPNTAIPDNNTTGISSTINVPDSFVVADVDVRVQITHTWVGDLCVTLTHNGVPVPLIQRMGGNPGCYSGSPFGCSQDNFNNIWIDDQGSGGPIKTQCVLNLTSPPNYTPDSPLSAFNNMQGQGAWTLTVRDMAGGDLGTLNSWGMKIVAVPPPPPACPADIAPPGGDGAVGVPDLLKVISEWGPCGGSCVADIAPPGGDGSVGVPDLLMVISNWGACQ